jgi:CIC family chloride channel protein
LNAIFAINVADITSQPEVRWAQLPNFLLLGILCGVVGVTFTRFMYYSEKRFERFPLPQAVRPAFGGLVLGITGAAYIVVFGWLLLGQAKPFEFYQYPMPAFFGDGYGAIKQLLTSGFYAHHSVMNLLLLLSFLILVKIFGTCMTLASGGSGGIIAPSVFLGATAGGLLGVVLRQTGSFAQLQPNIYALVGMGAVLAAVVHAPLASILILFELTQDPKVVLPAMLACVVATGIARLVFRDSIYTLSLRLRGVRVGTMADLTVLRRLHVEQVNLEPAVVVRDSDPFQRVLDIASASNVTDFVVSDKRGSYIGMLTADDIKTALLQREAVPLLLVAEVMRPDVPIVHASDDLATVLDTFARHDVARLPVTLANGSGQVIGLVSRGALMKRYQSALAEG